MSGNLRCVSSMLLLVRWLHYEGSHLGVGADEMRNDESQLSVHSPDHVRRCERQLEKAVHVPSKTPETTTTQTSVQPDKTHFPQMLHQSLWWDDIVRERKRAEQSRAEQSRAEQSRAEQSRAEQSRAEQSRAEEHTCMSKHKTPHSVVGISDRPIAYAHGLRLYRDLDNLLFCLLTRIASGSFADEGMLMHTSTPHGLRSSIEWRFLDDSC